MGPERLVLRVLAHAEASSAAVVPGKARAMISAIGLQVDARFGSARDRAGGPARPERPHREACWPCRSQGRAVLNWPSTTDSKAARCSGVRTIWPAPLRARRCETSSMPDAREDLEAARAEPVAQRALGAAHPRRHRVAVAPKGHAGLVVDAVAFFDGGRVGHRRERHQHLGVGQLADARPAWPPFSFAQLVGVDDSARAGAGGRRRWSTRTGPGSTGPRPGRWPSWCATSARSRTSRRTRRPPCGSRASAGTG